MQKSVRIISGFALIGLAIWTWRALFPSPESVIRSRLASLAKSASFKPAQGTISRAYNAEKVAEFFTTDVAIHLEIRGYEAQTWSGRDELLQALAAVAQRVRGVQVEFLDVHVTVAPDGQTAVADLTGKATLTGDRDFYVAEFNISFKKVEGKWMIYKVETVKVFSAVSPNRIEHALSAVARDCKTLSRAT